MRESKNLEFKQEISNTFLKTVSAFANYGTGEILFGVLDDGTVCGIKDPQQACLDIENRINDSIKPLPAYTLSINETTSVITLRVEEGLHKPYFYRSKGYRRNDSTTVEIDAVELKRLILEGENLSFEEQKAAIQDLQFTVLEAKLSDCLGVSPLTPDTLKTLGLYTDRDGYNIAAMLLADHNNAPGIDMVRFGDNISIILDRETFSDESILRQYDNAIRLFRKYYSYEEVKGSVRETKQLIPEAAFREVIANALVHRTWDIKAHINVAMFDGRIEVTSPGGLPSGLREEEFLRGGISIPRNRLIADVFLRLKMIERFGTGIRRINDLYSQNSIKPKYVVSDDLICITLPVISKTVALPEDSKKVYALLEKQTMASSAIVKATGFGRNKVVMILNELVEKGYIQKTGNGRGTKYRIGN